MKITQLLITTLCLTLLACESSRDKVKISVHAPGSKWESSQKQFTTYYGSPTPIILRRIPEFTEKSLLGIHSFPAEDGTFGLTMKLDFKGTNALGVVTTSRIGDPLYSLINGQPVDRIPIDKQVLDGVFTVWQGFTAEQIAILQKKYPHIHEITKTSSSKFLDDMTPSTGTEKKNAKKLATQQMKEGEQQTYQKLPDEAVPKVKISGSNR
jgi:hypothetical protein